MIISIGLQCTNYIYKKNFKPSCFLPFDLMFATPSFAGAIADPVEAWLRCGPASAKHTVVHGRQDRQLHRPAHGSVRPELEYRR